MWADGISQDGACLMESLSVDRPRRRESLLLQAPVDGGKDRETRQNWWGTVSGQFHSSFMVHKKSGSAVAPKKSGWRSSRQTEMDPEEGTNQMPFNLSLDCYNHAIRFCFEAFIKLFIKAYIKLILKLGKVEFPHARPLCGRIYSSTGPFVAFFYSTNSPWGFSSYNNDQPTRALLLDIAIAIAEPSWPAPFFTALGTQQSSRVFLYYPAIEAYLFWCGSTQEEAVVCACGFCGMSPSIGKLCKWSCVLAGHEYSRSCVCVCGQRSSKALYWFCVLCRYPSGGVFTFFRSEPSLFFRACVQRVHAGLPRESWRKQRKSSLNFLLPSFSTSVLVGLQNTTQGTLITKTGMGAETELP